MSTTGEAREWSAIPLDLLIERLLLDHHRWRDEVLPELASLLSQRRRQDKGPSALAQQQLFSRARHDLEEHLRDEETVLFAALLEMYRCAHQSLPPFRPAFGSVRNPIAMIQRDHDDAGPVWETLEYMARLNATIGDASEQAQKLYRLLANFAKDVRSHTAIENTILFPKALELEAWLREAIKGNAV